MASNTKTMMHVNLEEECPKFQKIYNDCFSKWYNNDFLKGNLNENPCTEEFEDFRACTLLMIRSPTLDIDMSKYTKQ